MSVRSVARLSPAIAAVLVFAAAGCASTDAATRAAARDLVAYEVIREDATIPFTSTVRNFRVGLDKSLLLDGPGGRWYRAQVAEPCKSDLDWEQSIGLADRAMSSVSKFTDVIVDGRRCQIISLDEIANPREAENAARAKAQQAATQTSNP
ncbi:MAG: hypothetical protein JNM47_06800 [Hyphomonadaceae bacterium]|nr:hypothetical protein [Hyphomonadaceae bacterium]